jgi:hypothetical protein
VDIGTVDGAFGEGKYYVDNFTLDENTVLLGMLRGRSGI